MKSLFSFFFHILDAPWVCLYVCEFYELVIFIIKKGLVNEFNNTLEIR